MSRVEVALPVGAALGEGPVWDVDAGVLHFVDIFAQRIHTFDPVTGTSRSVETSGPPGALALCTGGGWIAGIGLDVATVAWDGTTRPLARAPRGERLNDGKCDARGRFVTGTMDLGGPE